MAKKEPYDMTNSYARMERDKRKAIGNPNKNVHHKKNGSNYQKDTGSMVRSTSARQEPEKMSTTMKVLIGVVFVVLVAALVLRSTVWKDNVVAGAWMMVLVGAVCGLMYYVRKRYPGKRKVGGTMDTVISALLILFCVVYVGMGAMALVAMNKQTFPVDKPRKSGYSKGRICISARMGTVARPSDAKRAAVWCKADTEDSGEDHPGASG